MDIITLAMANKTAKGYADSKLDAVSTNMDYKGSVATVSDLPSGATTGDVYTVQGQRYVYDGTDWVEITSSVTVDSALSTSSTNAVQNKVITNTLDTKANIDGLYEDMTVGNAEQLVSDITTEDKVPYIFRTSGGSIDIGDRETDKIVGGTLAWNQLIPTTTASTSKNGITFTNNNGIWTLNGTATDRASVYLLIANPGNKLGHKMLLVGCPQGGGTETYRLGDGSGNGGMDLGNGSIYSVIAENGNYSVAIVINSGAILDNLVFKPQLFDLTAMFGSTIADYIYSLETANAGAGVAWFKKLFPKQYYAYNAGELLSVSGLQSHDMVGFNAWDEEWELGAWSNQGVKVPSTKAIRSTNKISVLPNEQYYFNIGQRYTAGLVLRTFDASESYVGSILVYQNTKLQTIPSDVSFITINTFESDNITVYGNDICINLSWDGERDGEYEAYEKHSYPLDLSLTLRGLPKLDANNELYYDGDTYESDGTVTRKYGIVDLGTVTWGYESNYNRHYFQLSELTNAIKTPSGNEVPNAICSNYDIVSSNVGWNNRATVKCLAVDPTAIRIYNDGTDDAQTYKQKMSGVYLVYELATPTTETAEPFTNPQYVDDFGTEEYVTDSIPVGHETKYQVNLKAKLEMSPNSPDGDGDYVLRQTSGQNSYVLLTEVKELPDLPTSDGNYVLKCTVSSGTATLTWEAQS